jgi:hypothetical protein
MPESLLTTVQAVRAKYGAAPSNDECAEIVNEVAWLHRADGWGVSSKPNGANGRQPTTGKPIARDIVHYRPTNEIFDCLVAAGDGGPASPAWQAVGVMTDPTRPWLAPAEPDDIVVDPDPDPDPEPDPVVALILAKLEKIDAKIQTLAVAQRQEELCNLTADRIATSTNAILSALAGVKCKLKLPW